MRRPRGPAYHRPAFTLLEMLLAAAIAVVLMGALYVAVDYQLRHAKTGREVLQQSLLARSVLTRMGNQIKLSVASYPASDNNSSSSSPTNSGSPSSAGSTASGSGGTNSTTSTAGSGTSYNLGLQGDANHLVFFLSDVPSEVWEVAANATDTQATLGISDLRQVTYWLSADGSGGQALAYRESKVVTSGDSFAASAAIADDPSCVIAPEIQSLQFRYFDGTDWQASWDATALGVDGSTRVGPPVAVEITVGVQPASSPAGSALKQYKHRVMIPVANGTAPLATQTTAP